MKVLHVYKDFYPVLGGIENHLQLLVQEQSRFPEMEVEVLVTNLGRQTTVEQVGRVRVTRAGRLASLGSTPVSLELFREIGRRDYDVIHLHFPYPPGEIAALLRGRTRRLVISYHSDIVKQKGILRLYHPLLLRVLSRADAIVASSPNYVDTSPYLSLFREKCTIIPYGVDAAFFHPAPDAPGVTEIMRPFPSPRILFVGQFRYYKGLQYLIEAMRQVPTGTLVLAGSGREEASLRAQVSRLGLEGRVGFAGPVPPEALPSVYQDGDLFVLPSCLRAEAFGIVQLEAMACGLPVISTELGTGTSYVNRHGETGLVVPAADPAALASAINLLLEKDRLRTEMGHAARERVETEFTKELMVERLLALYRKLL